MLSALALSAALLTDPAPAGASTDEILDALAAASYVVGMCEPFADEAKARSLLRGLSFAEMPEGEPKALLTAISARMYLDGRQDPRRPTMTAEVCGDLLIAASDRLAQAISPDRAIEGAEP